MRQSHERVRNGSVRQGLGLLAVALLACGETPAAGEAPTTNELLVAAAASLREPVERLADEFETGHPDTTVRLSFGASSALGVQIRLGAPVDVFLSADPRIVDELQRRGLVTAGDRFAFASNRLVVVRRANGGPPLAGPEDLLQPEVQRIAMPTEAVPVGHYARQWLARRGLIEALTPRLVATEHARATLAAVEAGHADLAIVYATDARMARRAEIAYRIPDAEQPSILYVAARLGAGDGLRAGDDFLRELRGAAGARVLREAGFGPVPGPKPARRPPR